MGIDVTAQTLLPNELIIGVFVTANGWLNTIAHEARRRDVMRIGYDAYLDPAQNEWARRCGGVCHPQPGVARQQLQRYLIAMRTAAISEWNRFYRLEQNAIDLVENGSRQDPDGNPIEIMGPDSLFDHFGNIWTIRDPRAATLPDCPTSTCP